MVPHDAIIHSSASGWECKAEKIFVAAFMQLQGRNMCVPRFYAAGKKYVPRPLLLRSRIKINFAWPLTLLFQFYFKVRKRCIDLYCFTKRFPGRACSICDTGVDINCRPQERNNILHSVLSYRKDMKDNACPDCVERQKKVFGIFKMDG